MNRNSIWWWAPEYFSRWRLFPRAFISMYIYLLWKVVTWFMALEAPTMEQAGLVSVIVGAGAAWFGLYVNSSSSKFEQVEVKTTSAGSEAKLVDTRETKKKTTKKKIDNSKYDNDY
tara:strand:- start:5224 stop:5571 length:348 start_codon:yes stop_codon:yes gene_type:complete